MKIKDVGFKLDVRSRRFQCANQFWKKLCAALEQLNLVTIAQNGMTFHKSNCATKGK